MFEGCQVHLLVYVRPPNDKFVPERNNAISTSSDVTSTDGTDAISSSEWDLTDRRPWPRRATAILSVRVITFRLLSFPTGLLEDSTFKVGITTSN